MCGDGILDPMEGEECDDGNQDTTDSCVGGYLWLSIYLNIIFIIYFSCLSKITICNKIAGCRRAFCGDSYLHIGQEDCDGIEFGGQSCNTYRRG